MTAGEQEPCERCKGTGWVYNTPEFSEDYTPLLRWHARGCPVCWEHRVDPTLGLNAHPLAEQFDCPKWKEPGRCICGEPLPPMSEWTNPGMDWSSVECPKCGRGYVDEEEFIAIYDEGLDPHA